MKKLIMALVIGVVACTPGEDAPRADGAAAKSDSSALASDTVAGDTAAVDSTQRRRAAAPLQFDPRQVRPGRTTIGGMTVAAVDVKPADSDVGVAGSVRFSGQAEVEGSYRAHFDYPEVKEPCFWVDINSWGKLPRAHGDERIVWFCFENEDEAIRQLGALGTQARATIVIDNYTTNLSQSDAWDTARLVRVVRKESF
jgi:hypothetical protein